MGWRSISGCSRHGQAFADLLALVQTVAFDGDAGVLRVRAVIDVPEEGVRSRGTSGTAEDRRAWAPIQRSNRRTCRVQTPCSPSSVAHACQGVSP